MIQSATYEIIKQEGFKQGMQQEQTRSRRKAICDALEVRLGVVPLNIIKTINSLDNIQVLEELFRKALVVPDLQAFRAVLKQILEPDIDS